ncbi:TetR family transcriptional regulator C-terminal domain-containing protein [Pseudorhodoferax sp. Leaf265]|uniref:TetR family transcriptional regulator C-terminal domain-containing protein n=1 Tax=Pseudorhodoferax sp. Leaf265 TaxID=1736315 RepID=UPI000A60E627
MANIQEAAIIEFSLHGLKGASTQGIAERAGLTKPQLHYYIAGKEQLYCDLLMHVLHEWKVVQAFDLDLGSPAAVLEKYIRQKLDHAFDHPDISRIFTREMLDGGENLSQFWPQTRAWTQGKIDAIEGWITQGLMRPLDARLLLMHIWATTQHYADFAPQVRVLLDHGPGGLHADRERIAQELCSLILMGCGLKPNR